ncbi:MAG: hypothetical protein LBS89_08970 [Zoogloeaceae bacterium]|jgi:hypothetical protein|nr:hypothetical protein [Zoogloeaceae bacterium]
MEYNKDMENSLMNIRHFYVRLRNLRRLEHFSGAKRRKLYRQIEAEKKRLLQAGADGEWVRLYCRYYATLGGAAERRLQARKEALEAGQHPV